MMNSNKPAVVFMITRGKKKKRYRQDFLPDDRCHAGTDHLKVFSQLRSMSNYQQFRSQTRHVPNIQVSSFAVYKIAIKQEVVEGCAF